MRLTHLTILFALLTAVVSTSFGHGGTDSRHWELASSDPDRIFLTFHGDPATRRAVTWRTDTSITNSFAEIAVALGEPNFDRSAKRYRATIESVELKDSKGKEYETAHYHSVIFTNLVPDTLHAYRVGNGNDRWSEWIQFRTASPTPAPFKFVYFGDAQNDVLSRWARVIRMANQVAPDAAFALHAGDLINRANRDVEWAEWFEAGSFLHAQWTGIPVIGNHECVPAGGAAGSSRTVSTLWRPQFTLPIEESLPESLHETVYSVDYQGARIIALNSCVDVPAQTEFLERELTRPGARWKIVSFHYPIFSPGNRKVYRPEDRQRWKALLEKYNVDFVLQGHDHTYVRGQTPVITNGVPSDTFQTLYVTSVSGPKQFAVNEPHMKTYEPEGHETIRQGMNTQFFQVLEFAGNRAAYRAYTATGELYDEAVVEKDFATGAKKIIQNVPATDERNFENTINYSKNGR